MSSATTCGNALRDASMSSRICLRTSTVARFGEVGCACLGGEGARAPQASKSVRANGHVRRATGGCLSLTLLTSYREFAPVVGTVRTANGVADGAILERELPSFVIHASDNFEPLKEDDLAKFRIQPGDDWRVRPQNAMHSAKPCVEVPLLNGGFV